MKMQSIFSEAVRLMAAFTLLPTKSENTVSAAYTESITQLCILQVMKKFLTKEGK